MTAIDRFRIARGEVLCEIAPGLGGSILALRVNGSDLLRPAPFSPKDVRETACFLMLPYANRIADGRLVIDEKPIDIGVDPDGAPHALHGHGWRNPWTLTSSGDDYAVLDLEYRDGAWPWPYSASQTLTLLPDGIEIRVDVTNRHATSVMPIGLGLHPYFERTSASVIRLQADRRWLTDATGLAIEATDDRRFARSGECTVYDLDGCDHFFSSPSALVCVNDTIELFGTAVAGAHIYAPTACDFFCVEPVSHVPNSFGRGEYGPLDLLDPASTRSVTFSIRRRREHSVSSESEVS